MTLSIFKESHDTLREFSNSNVSFNHEQIQYFMLLPVMYLEEKVKEEFKKQNDILPTTAKTTMAQASLRKVCVIARNFFLQDYIRVLNKHGYHNENIDSEATKQVMNSPFGGLGTQGKNLYLVGNTMLYTLTWPSTIDIPNFVRRLKKGKAGKIEESENLIDYFTNHCSLYEWLDKKEQKKLQHVSIIPWLKNLQDQTQKKEKPNLKKPQTETTESEKEEDDVEDEDSYTEIMNTEHKNTIERKEKQEEQTAEETILSKTSGTKQSHKILMPAFMPNKRPRIDQDQLP